MDESEEGRDMDDVEVFDGSDLDRGYSWLIPQLFC